jgi:hypothetical protein
MSAFWHFSDLSLVAIEVLYRGRADVPFSQAQVSVWAGTEIVAVSIEHRFDAKPIVRSVPASGDSILSHGGPPLRSASRQARLRALLPGF